MTDRICCLSLVASFNPIMDLISSVAGHNEQSDFFELAAHRGFLDVTAVDSTVCAAVDGGEI